MVSVPLSPKYTETDLGIIYFIEYIFIIRFYIYREFVPVKRIGNIYTELFHREGYCFI